MTATVAGVHSVDYRTIHESDSWTAVLTSARAVAPEAFVGSRLASLIGGRWNATGATRELRTPVDGTSLVAIHQADLRQAEDAVGAAVGQHAPWMVQPLAVRRDRVQAAIDAMRSHQDLLAKLLMWEIGKPWRLAVSDVTRCLDGVEWYVGQIDHMLRDDGGRNRLPMPGPVSNVASWNYPMSVQVFSELVQVLVGNAVVAKSPTQGGAVTLAVAHALMAQAGLPVSLLHGGGSELAPALVADSRLGAVAFVGGRRNGAKVAAALQGSNTRAIIEQEGLNTWGIWDFTDWAQLAAQLRKGYEYGKQRCTAYPRFIVQRHLFDAFLDTYLTAVQSLRIGNPMLRDPVTGEFRDFDFGPLISAARVAQLKREVREAIAGGATPLRTGELSDADLVPGQDRSAYLAPVTLLGVPATSRLRHEEPFGPVDSIVLVDSEAELLSEMNLSNGALVSTLSTHDEDLAARVESQVHAFKFGLNAPRSRGDKEEPFGGVGESWSGCFVGGRYLVEAVTRGRADDSLHGRFAHYVRLPQRR